MKSGLLKMLVAMFALLVLAGCYKPLDGRGVKVGVPFKKDKLYAKYERDLPRVFAASKEALALYGTLTREDAVNNVLEAKVDQSTVWVALMADDPGLTSVTVQARTKGGRADLELANEIDKQIALRLVEVE